MGNKGIALLNLKQPDKAIEALQEQENICRQIRNRRGLRNSLLHLTNAYDAVGALDSAEKALDEYLEICRSSGDKDGLATEATLRSRLSIARGDISKGRLQLERAIELYSRAGDLRAQAQSLTSHALMLRDLFRLPEPAAVSAKLALELVVTHGFSEDEAPLRRLIESLNAQIQHNRDETSPNIDGSQLDPLQLVEKVHRQAELAEQRGDTMRALKLYHDEETMRHELRDLVSEARAISNQANILYVAGDHTGAVRLYKKELLVQRKVNEPGALAYCLMNCAMLIGQTSRHEALSLVDEALDVAQKHGLDQYLSAIIKVRRSLSPENPEH